MTAVLAAGLLDPHVGLIFWMLLTFSLLLFILSKYAWKPMVGALDQREGAIADSLTRAEAALAEAKKLQADNESARRDSEAQAQAILREARDEAGKLAERERNGLRDELARMKEQFQTELAREKNQLRSELRAEVAALAVQGAEKILRQEIDGNTQQRLVEGFLSDLPQN